MTRVTIGAQDAPQWMRVSRPEPETVIIAYLEGVVTVSKLELPAELATELGIELAGVAPAGVEYRAAYPQQILPGSAFEYSTGDREHTEGIVSYVNRRLAAAGLPETAQIQTRELFATPWTTSRQSLSQGPEGCR